MVMNLVNSQVIWYLRRRIRPAYLVVFFAMPTHMSRAGAGGKLFPLPLG